MRPLAEWLLRIALPPEDRKHTLDELEELFQLRMRRFGPVAADRWRRRQTWIFLLGALPVALWKRPLRGFLGILSNRDGHLGTLDVLRQDLRFAFRSFRRRPGVLLSAILILGVGIGATTAIFSVVNTVMLKPLPYPQPLELMHFGGYGGVKPAVFLRWREALESFEQVDAAWNTSVSLTSQETPRTLRASRVTPTLLSSFGATPHLGRLFNQGDFEGGAPVAILGFGIWRTQWGGDPTVVGRTIEVDDEPVEVVGVLSPDFRPPEAVTGKRVDLWLALAFETPSALGWNLLTVFGRLKEGVAPEAAQSELDALTDRFSTELPEMLLAPDGSLRTTRLIPLQVATFGRVGGSLLLLWWAVILMLLIACANVANLLLAHGTARAREISLRGALGAGRSRIVRQLLTESVALGLLGGFLGVSVAYISIRLFRRFIPPGVPRIEELAVDPGVLLFALGASVLTGVVLGLLPARHASRRDVAEALKEGSQASTGSRRGSKVRGALVVAEISLALVLLTGAGLFFKSLMIQAEIQPGFQVDGLVSVPLRLGGGYDQARRQQFTEAVRERLRALPGVEGVASGLTVPFQYVGSSTCCITDEVQAVDGPANSEPIYQAFIHPVTPGYFATLDARVTHGRELATADERGDGRVAVINEAVARYFFGETDVVGRSILIHGNQVRTIVGVVEGVHHWGISRGIPPNIYVPYVQRGSFSDIYQLLVRSTTDVESLAPRIREVIASVDPDLPVEDIVPIRQLVEASTVGQRFLTLLLGTFAGFALLLASGGIYASMLYSVGQRRQEMGIRMALGASGGTIVGLVLKQGFILTLLGTVLGLCVAVGLSHILRSFLFGVSTADPLTIGGVTLVLAASALLACLVPAVRASRSDPLKTLKVE